MEVKKQKKIKNGLYKKFCVEDQKRTLSKNFT